MTLDGRPNAGTPLALAPHRPVGLLSPFKTGRGANYASPPLTKLFLPLPRVRGEVPVDAERRAAVMGGKGQTHKCA